MYETKPALIVVFATSDFLVNLFGRERTFVDATFQVVPSPFTQLFTFHAFLNGNKIMIPYVYVFMTHTTKHAYNLVFAWLLC